MKSKKIENVQAETEIIVPWTEHEYDEWMATHDVVRDEGWMPFTGSTRNQFADVLTKNGKVIGPCWLSKGTFVRVDDLEDVSAIDVVTVRVYVDKPVDRDTGDEDEETNLQEDSQDEDQEEW